MTGSARFNPSRDLAPRAPQGSVRTLWLIGCYVDKVVGASFWRVTVAGEGKKDFHELLLEAAQGKPGDRQRDVLDGVTLRLESCTLDGEYLKGEFCRVQTEHLPPSAHAGGVKDMTDDTLAHLAAFRYHVPTRVLLLQTNLQSATPMKIALYLSQGPDPTFFTFLPVLREDSWERFKNNRVRSYTVSFAAPENLSALDDPDLSVAKAAKLIAQAHDNPIVTIRVGAGAANRPDLDKNLVLRTFQKLIGSSAQIKAMSANTFDDDGSDPINFLKDHMKAKKKLNLPKKNAPESLAIREAFLKEEFHKNQAYFDMYFRKPKG